MKKFYLFLILISCGNPDIHEIYLEDGVAINGYDPVAYFTMGEPVKGTEEYTLTWKEALWKFSRQEHLDSFKANPEKYAPVFGGFCAYGMSNGDGYKATTDPAAWTIVEGKLYLNYSLKVKEKWLENQEERIQKARENWPRVRNDVEVKR